MKFIECYHKVAPLLLRYPILFSNPMATGVAQFLPLPDQLQQDLTFVYGIYLSGKDGSKSDPGQPLYAKLIYHSKIFIHSEDTNRWSYPPALDIVAKNG